MDHSAVGRAVVVVPGPTASRLAEGLRGGRQGPPGIRCSWSGDR